MTHAQIDEMVLSEAGKKYLHGALRIDGSSGITLDCDGQIMGIRLGKDGALLSVESFERYCANRRLPRW